MATDIKPQEHGANSEGSPFDIVLFLDRVKPAWMRRSGCRGYDPNWWWPEANDNETRERAQRICNQECPVRSECLQYGLTNTQEGGILGGLTERQRKTLRKRLRRQEMELSDAG